ncbi:MAG: MBL fold metallo-hydrolase [Deltaproteobacteria bacterium]|nr:MBL fold metallo-hydrolase [Deltaproteobacteria bacterium]
MPAPYVRQLQLGPMDNFVYLLGAPDSKGCVVIDPAWDVDAIVRAAAEDGRRLEAAFVSHGHADHMNGVAPLLEKVPLPVYAQRDEVAFFESLRKLGNDVKGVGPGEDIDVAGLRIRCLHTPGHTPGSQCFHASGALVTGDTLFMGACGRCDLPGGDPEQMFGSLAKLRALDPATVVYPGHDYGDTPTNTLGSEIAVNPYLKLATEDAFVAYRMRPRR